MEHWHASSIADCPRTHYYKRLGIPALTKPTGAKILRWQAGHHLESAIRPYLEMHYPDLKSNIRLTSAKLDLTGEYDNYSPKAKTLIEVKSVDDYAFTERDGRTTLRDDRPYPNHILQNQAYALLLEEAGYEVEKIEFVYLALKGRVVTYTVPISQGYLAEVKNILKILNQAWQTKTPPLCICDPTSTFWGPVYQWCDYRDKDGCCSLKLMEVANART